MNIRRRLLIIYEMKMLEIKKRLGVRSDRSVFAIIVVFAINGSFTAFVIKPIFFLIGIRKDELNTFIFYTLYIIPVFFIYQITLPYVGWIFGQYDFFKRMQNKIIEKVKSPKKL